MNGLSDTLILSETLERRAHGLPFLRGIYEILVLTEDEFKLEFPRTRKLYVDTFVKK